MTPAVEPRTPIDSSADFGDTFAFAKLDDSTLMGVYTDGDQVMRAELFDHFGNTLDEPIVLGSPRARPTPARTSDGICSAWEPAEVPKGGLRDDAHRFGDQVMPSLAAVPYWPKGALVAAWTDLSGKNFGGQATHADVVLSLIPTPVVRTLGVH